MEAELAMTSNALRVTQDSVLRNIDRADVAEAEVKRLRAQVATMRRALELAVQYVAKANADGAYTNTAMSGDRALAKINAALYGDSDQDAW